MDIDKPDPILELVVPRLTGVPGVTAVVLGGSRARGTATLTSDYDLGLYFGAETPLDTDHLREVVKGFVDVPAEAVVTPVGEWGKWIVGGGWLSVRGSKVDLLYRNYEDVAQVIRACANGHVTMDYQPGHPHGFCSTIWMGEAALCKPIHDPQGRVAELKCMTAPYPEPLRQAIIRRFQWEILFSVENGKIAAARNEQTHVAGCVYRALCCMGQVFFALNRRYLINEKGAISEASTFPQTLPRLADRVTSVWQRVGGGEFKASLHELTLLDQDLKALATL